MTTVLGEDVAAHSVGWPGLEDEVRSPGERAFNIGCSQSVHRGFPPRVGPAPATHNLNPYTPIA
ncbi:MAG: hypothetical protein KDA52_01360 [Planctomycetaceae bacterium]|nr:hypothetical protein [Planctomycetaceae bacterium]